MRGVPRSRTPSRRSRGACASSQGPTRRGRSDRWWPRSEPPWTGRAESAPGVKSLHSCFGAVGHRARRCCMVPLRRNSGARGVRVSYPSPRSRPFRERFEPMDESAQSAGTLPRAEAARSEIRRRFADAFRIRPWIYWADMLGSACVGWTLFAFATVAPPWSLEHLLASTGAVFALLRAALFIHELAHLRLADLRGFEAVWNLVVGIPVGVPSLMYVGSHSDHHKRTGFGTNQDPEYAPIAQWSRLRIALFVATVAFVPILLVLRWGVLGPLSRLVPALRGFVVGRCSTLVINVHYERPLPHGRTARRWAWQEAGTAALVWSAAAGWAMGWIPTHVVAQWFLVAAGILVVNQVRTLAAHRYENGGEPVDSQGQLLDSINLAGGSPFTALLAPVGLRDHALHHYLPSLPYHSLGFVHRKLLAELPDDAPYRRTVHESLLAPLQKLWHKEPVRAA